MLIPPKSFQLAWPIPFSICAVGNTESGFKQSRQSRASSTRLTLELVETSDATVVTSCWPTPDLVLTAHLVLKDLFVPI